VNNMRRSSTIPWLIVLITAGALTRRPGSSKDAAAADTEPSSPRSNGHDGNGAATANLPSAAPPSGKERLRGMNAAIAANGNGRVRPAARHSVHPWQLAMALLLVVAGVLAAVFTVRQITNTGNTFPAVVTSAMEANLNFENAGLLTEITVHPGDRVRAGQVLAREDQTVALALVNADKTTLLADKAQVEQLQNPVISDAQRQQLALQVQQAQATRDGARAATDDAASVAASSAAQAQTVVSATQSLVAGDQSRFTQGCPQGLVPPTSSSLGSAPLVLLQNYINCQNLQLQLQKDQATLAQVQGGISDALARGQQMTDQANHALVARDEYQVALDQVTLLRTTITAPGDGVVAEVNGSVGELVGSSGVHTYAGPAPVSENQPSFQLFPSAPSSSTSANQPSTASLVTIYQAGDMEVTTQVPESAIGSIHKGDPAKVAISALNTTVNATVDRIVAIPANSPGQVVYDVILATAGRPAGLLPGMTATVHVGT
jgi:multidrug efflux pump subunit AcrA (membrane-fusion protein)